jgi:anthranilate synthase component 2
VHILLLDNYDSFTYNLYHYLTALDVSVSVYRNDEITPEETDRFSHLVLSPGPGLPAEAGHLMAIINRQKHIKPILGICLGMQALAEAFGGTLYNQQQVKHGVTTTITTHKPNLLFSHLPTSFCVGLYHSWAVTAGTLPAELMITANSAEGVAMAIEHKKLPIFGVQFHPESILTEFGRNILSNWINATST